VIAQTLFVSDLHIRPERPDITRRFLHFLEHRAAGVERLYILGDLFDAWVGDDDRTPPNGRIIASLKQCTNSGTAIYFQQGNRDFLVGEHFAEASGTRILPDYEVIDLYGTPTLIMHGDLLCTDDVAYLAFRDKARQPEWQRRMLSKPLFLRQAISRWYRLRSHFHKRRKTMEIMDVNQSAVQETMHQHGVTRLIHGHTHRPGVHHIELEGASAQRFVLSEWNSGGDVLCWDADGYRIEPIAAV
jgi:UDP-2,3-diacylglucosamine hydrolase